MNTIDSVFRPFKKLVLYMFLLTVMVLIHWSGTSLLAQSIDPVSELATVFPEKSDKVEKAHRGSRIFTDQDYVIEELPQFLTGLNFISGSMINENRIVPVTTGVIYMITPLEGQAGSQEEMLKEEGFSKVDYPSFKLYKEQIVEIGIFKKNIEYQRFRLDDIRYDSWAIPFFEASPLPSITIPADVIWSPEEDKYAINSRLWQGIPSIELTERRLWGAWFSGGTREPDSGNYGIISYSDDDGDSWVDPAMVIAHPDERVRVMDPQLWKDPLGRLWIFWVQNTGEKGFDGIWGTWAIRIDNPGEEAPSWTTPRRLADGLTRNSPVVLSTGEWLLPSYDWINHQSAVYVSHDQGDTWQLQGGPINKVDPGTVNNFYEHMMVELKDGTIWMLQRNVKESYSYDKGKEWTELDTIPEMTSANSRLYIGRLQSGNLLLVYNNDPERETRKNLTAYLSKDDGKTWPYKLLLDERNDVSYPDATQNKDGLIYLTYDRSRTGEKEVLLTTFTEDDIINGEYMSEKSRQKKIISKVDE